MKWFSFSRITTTLKRFLFGCIKTSLTKEGIDYTNGRLYLVKREVRFYRWPKFISHIIWKFSKLPYRRRLTSDIIDMQVNCDTDVLLVDGEPLIEWLRNNCRGEIEYNELFEYFHPHARPTDLQIATVCILFKNPKDAIAFKLRFG